MEISREYRGEQRGTSIVQQHSQEIVGARENTQLHYSPKSRNRRRQHTIRQNSRMVKSLIKAHRDSSSSDESGPSGASDRHTRPQMCRPFANAR
ncbi:hypothetical protein LSAT2_033076 [Lamellibrachia satsuma]|nr:hypothetical protein LSAT2_033076 [Lamellibrachia satsuma]